PVPQRTSQGTQMRHQVLRSQWYRIPGGERGRLGRGCGGARGLRCHHGNLRAGNVRAFSSLGQSRTRSRPQRFPRVGILEAGPGNSGPRPNVREKSPGPSHGPCSAPAHEESATVITAADPPEPDRDSAPGVLPPAGVVVGVDLRGIQSYVYSGHRILDAVGRAALVAEITDTSDAEHGIADLVPKGSTVLRDAGGGRRAVCAHPTTSQQD